MPLQQGQTVQLELIQTNGRQVLSLVSAESAKATQTSAVTVQPLAQGQKYLAQVIKVLNDSRIVIELKSMPANEQLAQGQVRNSAAVTTQQIDVDIAKLAKQFTVGEKLLVDVIIVNRSRLNYAHPRNLESRLSLPSLNNYYNSKHQRQNKM